MFKPVNRYIQIEIPEPAQPETSSGILLPDSFKPAEERHQCVKAICAAEDVKFKELLKPDSVVVVDKTMIEEINFMGKSINVILENYILGVIEQ